MREVKVSHLLNCTLEDFLVKVGAGHGKTGYPSEVFMSHKDAAVLRRNNRRKFRKEKPYLRKRYIDDAIGGYWLQYGPSELLGKAVRPGYALVNDERIAELHKAHTDVYSYKVTAVVAEPTWKDKLYNFITLNWI